MSRFVVVSALALGLALIACATSETTPTDAPTGDPDAATIDAAAIDATDARPTDAAIDATDASTIDACVPSAEVCNGVDDNCSGTIDETFPMLGTACTAGSGPCQDRKSVV